MRFRSLGRRLMQAEDGWRQWGSQAAVLQPYALELQRLELFWLQ